MNNPMKAFVALDQTVDRSLVEAMLTSSSRLSVIDYGDIDTLSAGADRSDVLVVACGHYTPEVAEYIGQATRTRVNRPVVLLAPVNGNGYVSDAFGHGADDVVTLPSGGDPETATRMAPDLVFALEKAVARKRGSSAEAARGSGEMICVLGLKGGSGKTLTCANLAVALADAGARVAVVDLDLQFGDIGLALGLEPERTMYDLVRAGGSLDDQKVADFMAVHRSGARVLLAPTRPDHAAVVTPEFLRDVYQVLRETSDFVIVDTPPVFTPEVIAAVDSATAVCMVAMLDSLSLKNTKLGLETLELMDYDSQKVRFVLNRADSKVGISPDDVISILGRAPAVLVPSDRNITRSINQGEPIALAHKRTDAARAFRALARLYLSDVEAKQPAARHPARSRRLFRRR
jgi:pilus assembly protein CpaE